MRAMVLFAAVSSLIGCSSTALDWPWAQAAAVAGVAQKGPFVTGGRVTLFGLDNTWHRSGVSSDAEIEDDAGTFAFDSQPSRLVELEASGSCFDEIAAGRSTLPVTLRAVTDLARRNTANVNLLTTLAADRLRLLIAAGTSPEIAGARARAEVLSAFGIMLDQDVPFEDGDITMSGDPNAALLAISVTIAEMATMELVYAPTPEASLDALVAELARELAEYGSLHNSKLEAALRVASMKVDADLVRKHLTSWYRDLGRPVGLPAFERFLDTDGDGVLNLYDFPLDFRTITTTAVSTPIASSPLPVWLGAAPPETATVTSGALIVNGVNTGSTAALVADGDMVAIELVSAPRCAFDPVLRTALITIGSNQGSFTVATACPQVKVLGQYNPDYNRMSGLSLAADGTRAYLGCTNGAGNPDGSRSDELQVVSLVPPGAPWRMGGVRLPAVATSQLADGGLTLFAAGVDNTIYMPMARVVDLSTPTAPALVDSFGPALALAVAADGSLVVTLTVSGGLEVWSRTGGSPAAMVGFVAPPTDCLVQGTVYDPSRCRAAAVTLSADARTAYVASGLGGLRVVDLTAPTTPTVVGTWPVPSELDQLGDVALRVDGNIAFAVGDGVIALDVSEPATPTEVGRYRTSSGSITRVTTSTRPELVYISGSALGFVVLDAFDLGDLHVRAQRRPGATEVSNATEVSVTPDGRFGALTGDFGFISYDLTTL